MSTTHHAVGLIVCNHSRTRYYVQQKDASYPSYPLGYSLFGGAREPGESTLEALARELAEELGDAAPALLAAGPILIQTTNVGPSEFRYSLYEVVIDDAALDQLARAPVFEGERGAVVSEAELRELPFIWDLGGVIVAYLNRQTPTPAV
jgi:8-oxo-dGTP pyrophosphatase MutT (NUDIX family)